MPQEKAAKPAAKILWLENEMSHFDIARKFLKSENFQVIMVDNLAAFDEWLRKETFDLIIVDIRGNKFNGLEVIQNDTFDFGDAKLCVLSGFLNDKAIEEILIGINKTIYVLDKSYPFDDLQVVSVSLEVHLKRILNNELAHTNRTYFLDVNKDDFDVENGQTDYPTYTGLTPSQKNYVKNTILELAEPEIAKQLKRGFRWFLVCGPHGRIAKKSKTLEHMSSSEISHFSEIQNFPCFTTTRLSVSEEVRPAKCTALYGYYFSLRVSFSGESEDRFDIHFDTGSESSWFDLDFLKSKDIGLSGDLNCNATLQTARGLEEIWYYSETKSIAVYDQAKKEDFAMTSLELRGLNNWHEMPFSGCSENPEEDLCARCAPSGQCQARVGLIGQNILRSPDPFAIKMDGATGLTAPNLDD